MALEEAIKRYTSNAFYEKSDGNLQGYLEFNQLTEWLKELKAYKEQSDDIISRQAALDAISRIGLCKCNTNEIEAVAECLRAVENLQGGK